MLSDVQTSNHAFARICLKPQQLRLLLLHAEHEDICHCVVLPTISLFAMVCIGQLISMMTKTEYISIQHIYIQTYLCAVIPFLDQ